MKSHCPTLQQTTPEIAFVNDCLPRGERGGITGGYLRGLSEFKIIQQNIEYLAYFGAF